MKARRATPWRALGWGAASALSWAACAACVVTLVWLAHHWGGRPNPPDWTVAVGVVCVFAGMGTIWFGSGSIYEIVAAWKKTRTQSLTEGVRT